MEKDATYALGAGIYVWIQDNSSLVALAQTLAKKCVDLGLCDTNMHNPFQIVPTDLFAENGNLHALILNENPLGAVGGRLLIRASPKLNKASAKGEASASSGEAKSRVPEFMTGRPGRNFSVAGFGVVSVSISIACMWA